MQKSGNFLMKSNKYFIYFLVVIAMIIWGLSYVWVKTVYQFYSPVTTVFLRTLIAMCFFILLSLILRKFQVIKKKDIKIFLLLGLFDPFGFFLFEGLGLKYTSPAISAIIISTIPLLLPIVTFFTLKERLSKFNIFGIIISFAGVLMVIIKDDFTLSTSLIGLLFLLVAVGFSIISNIMLKKLSDSYNIYTIITWLNIISSIYFLPLFFTFEFENFITVQITSTLLIPLLSLGIFASGLAFLFYIKGLKDIGVAKTNIFVNIIPVFAAIFSYWLLDEILTKKTITGITIVISGLFISQWKSIRKLTGN